MKKVLIVCTGNSCRSIMAEAIINSYLSINGVEAFSCGSNPKSRIDPFTQQLLEERGVYNREVYYPKSCEEFRNEEFDLVVTVCDSAKEECPTFPNAKERLHMSFEDPEGKDFKEFEKTFFKIRERLLPKVEEVLEGE